MSKDPTAESERNIGEAKCYRKTAKTIISNCFEKKSEIDVSSLRELIFLTP